MKEIGKIFLSALLAWIAGVAIVAGMLYVSNDGVDFTIVDLTGFAGLLVMGSAVMMLVLYLPAFLWLTRKRSISSIYFPLLSGVVLNLPAYLVLGFLAGRKMAPAEAVTFMITYLVIGSVFGASLVFTGWTARNSS